MNKFTASFFAGVALVAPAFAHPEHGDIWLYPQNGQLRTGLISEDESETTPNVRVFFAEFGEDVPNFSDEPGWLSPDGTWSGEGSLSFTITRALRQWNGFDFSTVAASRIEMTFGPLGPIATPLTDTPVTGFALPIDDEGGLHDHPDYLLTGPASGGVYLLELVFSVNIDNVTPSLPVWILFGQDADEETIDAAYDWAVANVPGPGAPALFAGAAFVAMRRRRSR
ncbi:MAG: hypothetical protein KF864_07980 [Phycisphaeraceae bacterium]|nr:hypothetical protein [Phycisphaeraceae bacterium]